MSSLLPQPSGKFPVACVDIVPAVGRNEIFFRLYYPTPEYAPTEENLALWTDDRKYIYGYSRFLDLPRLTWLMNYFIGDQKIPVLFEGPLHPGDNGKKIPVIVFSHGLGGNRTVSSFICYEMASYGFIVAAVEHKDLSASATYNMKQSENSDTPERNWMYMIKLSKEEDLGGPLLRNMQARKRTRECIKCLDHLEELNSGKLPNVHSKFDLMAFKGALDLTQVIMMGHSFGGATSLLTLRADSRFKIGCMLDAWIEPIHTDLSQSLYEEKIEQPMLFVYSEQFQTSVSRLCFENIIPADPNKKKMLKLLGTTHKIFSDFSLLLPTRFGKTFDAIGSTDSISANKATIELMLRFIGNEFDLPFKGSLDTVVDQYDFLIYETSVKDDDATQSDQTQLLKE